MIWNRIHSWDYNVLKFCLVEYSKQQINILHSLSYILLCLKPYLQYTRFHLLINDKYTVTFSENGL